jgi:hypothetical protein
MIDTTLPVALTLSSGAERMFPTLMPAQVKRIAAHGQVRSIRPGEVLVEAEGSLVVLLSRRCFRRILSRESIKVMTKKCQLSGRQEN